MAFLRSVTSPEPGPIIYGGSVFLRVPQMSDYSGWAELREQSRDFLVPWEPAWTSSELTRSSFRRRLKFYERDLREDLGYAFFLFDNQNDTLLGGLTLSKLKTDIEKLLNQFQNLFYFFHCYSTPFTICFTYSCHFLLLCFFNILENSLLRR